MRIPSLVLVMKMVHIFSAAEQLNRKAFVLAVKSCTG